MPETPTPPLSSTEKTVVVNSNHLCRLWILTYISLGLNALILAGLLACAILHHHKHHGLGGREGRDGGRFGGQYQMGFGHRFHHFGGMGRDRGWGRSDRGPGGFGGERFGKNGPGDGFRGGNGFQGHNGDDRGFGGRDGGPRDFSGGPGGPGMRGLMGGGTPDPAKMTDGILNHLSTTLALTDDEKTKIKPIIADQVAQMQKEMEAQRAAMQKEFEDGKAKIRPLLTPDQQKQLDAMPLPGQKPPPSPDAAKPDQPPGQ